MTSWNYWQESMIDNFIYFSTCLTDLLLHIFEITTKRVEVVIFFYRIWNSWNTSNYLPTFPIDINCWHAQENNLQEARDACWLKKVIKKNFKKTWDLGYILSIFCACAIEKISFRPMLWLTATSAEEEEQNYLPIRERILLHIHVIYMYLIFCVSNTVVEAFLKEYQFSCEMLITSRVLKFVNEI
jgi:hypothetical protein